MTETDEIVLDSNGEPEGKECVDCKQFKPFDAYQRTPTGTRAKDCKACRRLKFEAGLNKNQDTSPATKDWVVKEAKSLYRDPRTKLNDKIKLLDTIARNIAGDGPSPTSDAKVVRDLIAAKKKMKDMGR